MKCMCTVEQLATVDYELMQKVPMSRGAERAYKEEEEAALFYSWARSFSYSK